MDHLIGEKIVYSGRAHDISDPDASPVPIKLKKVEVEIVDWDSNEYGESVYAESPDKKEYSINTYDFLYAQCVHKGGHRWSKTLQYEDGIKYRYCLNCMIELAV